jgi:type VI protein secretion system component VasK
MKGGFVNKIISTSRKIKSILINKNIIDFNKKPLFLIFATNKQHSLIDLFGTKMQFANDYNFEMGVKNLYEMNLGAKWWISNDMNLIDYDGSTNDFTQFISELYKVRRKQTVNGVIVSLSIENLLNNPPAVKNHFLQLVSYIRNIRKKCHIVVPVYLLLTDLETLVGFECVKQVNKSFMLKNICGVKLDLTTCSNIHVVSQTIDLALKALKINLFNFTIKSVDKAHNVNSRQKIVLFFYQFSHLMHEVKESICALCALVRSDNAICLKGFYLVEGGGENNTEVSFLFGFIHDVLLVDAPLNSRSLLTQKYKQWANTTGLFILPVLGLYILYGLFSGYYQLKSKAESLEAYQPGLLNSQPNKLKYLHDLHALKESFHGYSLISSNKLYLQQFMYQFLDELYLNNAEKLLFQKVVFDLQHIINSGRYGADINWAILHAYLSSGRINKAENKKIFCAMLKFLWEDYYGYAREQIDILSQHLGKLVKNTKSLHVNTALLSAEYEKLSKQLNQQEQQQAMLLLYANRYDYPDVDILNSIKKPTPIHGQYTRDYLVNIIKPQSWHHAVLNDYIASYKQHWQATMRAVNFPPFTDLEEASLKTNLFYENALYFDVLFDLLQENLNIGIEIDDDLQALIDYSQQQWLDDKDKVKTTLQEINHYLKKITQAPDVYQAAYQAFINIYDGENNPIVQLEQYANFMPEIAKQWVVNLVNHYKQLLNHYALGYINTQWQQQVYLLYKNNFIQYYPVEKTAPRATNTNALALLFSEKGKLHKFIHQFPIDCLRLVGATSETIEVIKQLAYLSSVAFDQSNLAHYPVTITPVVLSSNVAAVSVHYNGQKMHYAHGPSEPVIFSWPSNNASKLIVRFHLFNGEVVEKAFSGPWAIFQWLEQSRQPQAHTNANIFTYKLSNYQVNFSVRFHDKKISNLAHYLQRNRLPEKLIYSSKN